MVLRICPGQVLGIVVRRYCVRIDCTTVGKIARTAGNMDTYRDREILWETHGATNVALRLRSGGSVCKCSNGATMGEIAGAARKEWSLLKICSCPSFQIHHATCDCCSGI